MKGFIHDDKKTPHCGKRGVRRLFIKDYLILSLRRYLKRDAFSKF